MKPVQEFSNYIGGAWTKSSSGESFLTIDPGNGDQVSSCQKSATQDLKSAIEAARKAFGNSKWATDLQFRISVLVKLCNFLSSQDFADAAELMTRECGPPLRYNLPQYSSFSSVLESSAFRAKFLNGQTTNTRPGILEISLREPIGVVGMITPWNGPITLLARTLCPALAAGCTVVIKPASATAGATMKLIEAISKFGGIPSGVINCVTGSGSAIGSALARDGDVDMISFTGDVTTGKEIARLAVENLKKVTLELGGKSPNVVFSDADMDTVAREAVSGAGLFHAGQICFAGTRVIVEESCKQKFIEAFKSTVRAMKVGHGLSPASEIGPVINEPQLEKVMNYVEIGKRESKLVMGGYRLEGEDYDRGNFVAPTLFDEVPPDSKLAQEEIFGPVVSVIPFSNLDEALEISNNSKYGLSAVLWTDHLKKVIPFIQKIRAGMVWINSSGKGSGYFNTFALTGSPYKESGTGSIGTVEEYTLAKRVHLEATGM